MKKSKRMNTNQTANSNKKSPQNPHQATSFQLPKIQKTSNYDTTSNVSYDLEFNDQKQFRYPLDQIEENQKEEFGVVNYDRITMEQIKHQYQRLRDEVATLSSEVKRKSQLLQSKIIKKQNQRPSNSIETQKKLAQTQHQVYENSQILFRLRQEYQQLEKRSNLANSSISRPNAEMNQKILSLREKILTIKEKIKLLKRKTKKTGNDIVDGENIHEVFEKLDRELKSYEAKQANLESKIDGSKHKIDRQDQMLNEIYKNYSDAEEYLKLFKLENEQIEEKNTLVQEYKQKIHKQQILRKKIESDQQTHLQKYHQLLKLFEFQTEKQEKNDKKLIDGDINILKASNTILNLERQLQELEDISLRMNEQISLKKQADLLRSVMQRNDTFMTENGFSLASHSINNHMIGVKSIIEENESEVRETIQNTDNKESGSIQTLTNSGKAARVKTIQNKGKMMFTKIQNGGESVPKKQNRTSTTTKAISEETTAFNEAKYYLSNKDISKKRDEQKNITTLRKQNSTNDNKNGCKAYSLIKPNGVSKLKELSINRTANKQIKELKIPNIREKNKGQLPLTAKQPYLSVNRNERQEKGKESLRQRKSSLKIVTKQQNQNTKLVDKSLLDELQLFNRQLEANNHDNLNLRLHNQTIDSQKSVGNNENLASMQKTRPLLEKEKQKNVSNGRISQQISSRAQLTGKIVKPSSKQGRVAKPDSKQGRIRHQPVIKPEMLSEMDKRNMEYTQKIEKMKQQLVNKEGAAYEKSQKSAVDTKTTTIEPRQQNANIVLKQTSIEKQDNQKKIEGTKRIEAVQFAEISIITHQKQPADQDSESAMSEDGDIEDDLSEINRMIKEKLQSEQISAE